jgi:hypothetical protein
MMADSVLMYSIAAASFLGLSIILCLSKSKIRHRSPYLRVIPVSKKESKHTSRRKRFKSLKEFFANENSIFDERNKDGLSGYSPWS